MSKKIPMFETTEPYVPIGRELLLEDTPDPDTGLSLYHRDVGCKAYAISRRGQIPLHVVEPESIMVPSYEIGCRPSIKRNEKRSCPYNLEERADFRARDSIGRLEDSEVLKVINAAIPSDHQISVSGFLQPENVLTAFGLIESHDLTPRNVVMHPMRYAEMRMWEHDEFYEYPSKSEKKHRAAFYDAKVFTSTMCPKNAVYVLADPKYVGVIVDHSDVETSQYAEDEKQRDVNVLSKTLGIAVVNNYALVRILLEGIKFQGWGTEETPKPDNEHLREQAVARIESFESQKTNPKEQAPKKKKSWWQRWKEFREYDLKQHR